MTSPVPDKLSPLSAVNGYTSPSPKSRSSSAQSPSSSSASGAGAGVAGGSSTSTAATNSGNGSGSSRTNPRKGSAERSINHTRMTTDEEIQKEYTYDVIIGEGSFGKVYRAQHNASRQTVAIKEIVKEKAGSNGIRQLDQEVSIFKKVDHQNIIKLNEVIESPKKTYLIMELCEGGDLAQLLQKRSHLTETDTKVVMKSLAEAIKYLHQQGILHRDLKLENILLSEVPDKNNPIRIKLSDFGLSTQLNNNSFENMKEEYCGTPVYMAPEMNSTYSYLVDVWAMGIIMYYLLTEYPKDNLLNESIKSDGPQFKEPQWVAVSEQAKDLLREILTQDPAHRISSGEVLNHEWFTGKKREHPNVLKMMKEFRREQEEERTARIDENANSAINGIADLQTGEGTPDGPAPTTTNGSGKKEVRKGSGGKKSTSGDRSGHTPPSSSKPSGKKREHPNVLKMMKEFRREQEEERTARIDENANSAINGIADLQTGEGTPDGPAPTTTNGSGKKEVRKGSGGKKSTSGDRSGHTPPSSSKPSQRLKPGGASSVAQSPRIVNKTSSSSSSTSDKPSAARSSKPSVSTTQSNSSTARTSKAASSQQNKVKKK